MWTMPLFSSSLSHYIKKEARKKKSKLPYFVSLGWVIRNVFYFYLYNTKMGH